MPTPRRARTHLVTVFALLATALSATEVTTLPVGPKPESVTRGFESKLFVSLMGESRALGDSDGSIVSLEEKTSTVTTFATGFDDPKGLVFTGTHLITADFKTVWRIDASGKKEILAAAKNFPTAPLYLNDVALSPDGKAVLVTDMGARDKILGPSGLHPLDSPEARAVPALGRVYRIALDTGTVSIALDHHAALPCPNGLHVLPDDTLLLAEFFTGNLLSFAPGSTSPTTLSREHRSCDGLAHDTSGNLYVSEVLTGRIHRISPDGQKTLLLTLPSAADHLIDDTHPEAPRLLIPDTKSGTLVLLPLTK